MVKMKIGGPGIVTPNQSVIAGIVIGQAFKSVRGFVPFRLFVGIKLTGRRRSGWCGWVLDRRVELLYRRGKRSLGLCLPIIKIVAAGNVEQNGAGDNSNCHNEWTTSLLEPVLGLLVESDHRVVSVLHLLDGDLLLPSYRLCQNSQPPDRVLKSLSDKVIVEFRGADAKDAPKI